MKLSAKEKAYALETTGLFITGLGMMLLVLVSAWLMGLAVTGTQQITDEIIGNAPRLNLSREDLAGINQLVADGGRVAGVVDDSATDEDNLRNEASAWLSAARQAQGLDAAYRDSILDRQAQNQARFLADNCSVDQYSNWEESIGLKINEGYVQSFSESIFPVSGVAFASELPFAQVDYSRLFQASEAYGVGVAATGTNCGQPYIMVVHLATTD